MRHKETRVRETKRDKDIEEWRHDRRKEKREVKEETETAYRATECEIGTKRGYTPHPAGFKPRTTDDSC